MLLFHIFTEGWPRCFPLDVLDNFRRNLYPTVAPFRIDKISPNPAVCAPPFTFSAFLLSQLDALIGDASSVVWLISCDLSFRFFCFFLKDRRLREASSLSARLSLAVSASPTTCQGGETTRWEVRHWKSTFSHKTNILGITIKTVGTVALQAEFSNWNLNASLPQNDLS